MLLVAGILVATASAALPPLTAGAAGPSAATLYRQALATTKGWSLHYASTGTTSGVAILLSGDAGPASGVQQVLVTKGAISDNASLIVIGSITYLKGNAHALTDLAGLSPAQAQANVGKWVQFATANQAFAQIVVGVRSGDVAQELKLTGPFSLGTTRQLNGMKVDAIRGMQRVGGNKAVRVVLFVRANGTHVPVEEDTVNAQGHPTGAEHTVYSMWGESVRPTAPSASVTIGPVTTT